MLNNIYQIPVYITGIVYVGQYIPDTCIYYRYISDSVIPHTCIYYRYILDSGVCEGKYVLDVGSGCGAGAIAAAMTGAIHVIANDIDTGQSHQSLMVHLNINMCKKTKTLLIRK